MPILAIGGVRSDAIARQVMAVADKPHPRLLYVGTASAESDENRTWIDEVYGGDADVTHLRFFPWPPRDLRAVVLEQDIVLVGGGNTANMLAIWRTHGFDAVLREAWQRDILLTGWSAGAICWFEAGVTDSFGPQLEGMDCLGFLRGSACPHYDGEELRRPRYAELLRSGFPAGIAIDDDVAVRFDGNELAEVLSARDGATAYRVSAERSEPFEARRVQ
jgi:dipeptidase E